MEIYSPILFILSEGTPDSRHSFEVIKKLKPPSLYIFAQTPNELFKIVKEVDWQCKIEKTIAKNKNDSPLAWFFSLAEEGIIIQDSCIVDPSFIYFAQAMLERYRAKKEVLIIKGYNMTGNWKSKYSYFFSTVGVAGGWASWRRAWDMHRGKLLAVFENGFLDWSQSNLMSIVPSTNLIDDKTHTPVIPITFPLNHQIIFEIESEYNKLLLEKFGNTKPITP